MPQGPAARVADPVVHPLPPVLTPGPGSLDVMIGFMPAWRGVPAAAAAALQAAKATSDAAITAAQAATAAAVGPALPAAKAAEEATKASCAASMGSAISSGAGGADIHVCATPFPVPPHGPGVIIDGSQTVLINNLPACRQGDTIMEAIGPPNKVAMGCMTVIIGDSGSGSGGSGSAGGGSGGPGGSTPTGSGSQSLLAQFLDSIKALLAKGVEKAIEIKDKIVQVLSQSQALKDAAAAGSAFVEKCKK